MAYKSYIWPCASNADLWPAFKNFMTAVGWTIHDEITTDKIVWKTQGESGTNPTYYLYVEKSTNLTFRPWLYWDATTHTGTVYAGNSSIFNLYAPNPANGDTLLCGDKDGIFACTNVTTTSSNYHVYCGYIPNPVSTKYTTTTEAVTSGSNVSIPVASSSEFGVGMYVQIVSLGSEGRDRLLITSVPDATHVVVSSLPRNYASGALIGFYPFLAGIMMSGSTFYAHCYHTDVGTTSQSSNLYYAASMLVTNNQINPQTTRRQIIPYFFYYSGVALGVSKNTGPCAVYGSAGDILALMNDNSFPTISSVTSATSTSITDSSKSWTPDALIGKYVIIASGTGVNQIRKITDNDATSITVADAFYTTPDLTSEYKIVDGVYRNTYVGTWKLLETTVPPTP